MGSKREILALSFFETDLSIINSTVFFGISMGAHIFVPIIAGYEPSIAAMMGPR